MRYIGCKAKLLGFIRRTLETLGVRPGRAIDPFSGTASVARALKEDGFGVVAADVMSYAYLFARAYVELDGEPDYSRLEGEVPADGESAGPSHASVLRHLEALEPEPGFIHEHYTPAGSVGREHGRMYFTPENAARIDAARRRIRRWWERGRIGEDARDVLVAALIEGADRVANTTGVYASFVKSWQPNARRRLELRPEPFVAGNGNGPSRAVQGDAADVVEEAEPFDLLYLDPPYNTRQYAGYYHIPELLAEGWFEERPPLRGKTGLIPDAEKRSDWSKKRRCEGAFEELVAAAPCRWVVMSYSAEGIIPEETIEEVFREHGDAGSYRRFRKDYRRYRSDEDGENRSYKADRVAEYLYCVRKE